MLHVILFCDNCNSQSIRYIEQQYQAERGDISGRRIIASQHFYPHYRDKQLS